jgi:hypothetical protein
MSTKSREVIWGGQNMGAEIRAKGAREADPTAPLPALHPDPALPKVSTGPDEIKHGRSKVKKR